MIKTYYSALLYGLLCGWLCFGPMLANGQAGLVKMIGTPQLESLGEMRIVNDEVYICGSMTDNAGVYHGMLAKYDLSGNRIWESLLSIPSTTLLDFTVLPNGEIYAVGFTLPWNSSTDNQTVVAHFDAGGNVIRSKLLYQTGRELAYRILPKPDGSGLLVLGQTNRVTTGISDQGVIMELDFNLNFVGYKRHLVGNGDTELARNMFYNSPTELLIYGLSPALNGDMGLVVANDAGDFTGENYRLSSPGTNRITPFSMTKGANGELYVSGSVDFPDEGLLMSLHADDFSVRWAYRFPGLIRVFEMTAPDISGYFHAIVYGNINGLNRSALIRFQETSAGLNLINAAYLDEGETTLARGQIALRNQDVAYMDVRIGNPSGFGDYDYLYAYLDSDYESCISVEAEFEFAPTDVIIAPAQVTQTELDFPEEEVFESSTEVFLEQSIVCEGCGELVITDKAYDCAPQPTYTMTFDLVNNSAFPVTSMVVRNDIDPSQDAYFNFYTSPIPPGGTMTGLTLPLTFPVDLTDPLTVCLDIIFFSDEAVCCHFETCFDLLPPDPCGNTSVEYEEVDDPELEDEGECCYNLHLVNDFCSEYFTNVTTEIITPGVVYTNYNSTLLNTTISPDSRSIVWDNPGGFLPLGPLDDMTICIGGILSASQTPQMVAVNWYAIDPATGEEFIACTDTLEFFCQPCLTLEDELVCDPETGGYFYNFTVLNNSDHLVTSIVFENHTPGVSFEPPLINVTLPPGATYSGTIFIDDFGTLNPGDIIEYKLILFDEEGWCCHLDDIMLVVPDCDGDPFCDCSDIEGFFLDVDNQAGLSHEVDCDAEVIRLSTETLTDCDQTSWTLTHLDTGESLMESSTGNMVVTFPIINQGEYRLAVTIQRVDDQGNPCPELITDFFYSFEVDCQFVTENPDEELEPPLTEQFNQQSYQFGGYTLGVDATELALKAYPSPVSQFLNVEISAAGNYLMEVFDSSNRRLWQYRYDLNAGQSQQLNVNQWPSGVYILRVTSKNGEVLQQRFVKMKH